jgi:threonine/homoserine/homoserine lactone efflux protein
MIGGAAGLGIALVALGLVLTSGPSMVYLVSRSVTQGRGAGLVSLLAVMGGVLGGLALRLATERSRSPVPG